MHRHYHDHHHAANTWLRLPPTFGQQLATSLGPALNLQLRCTYTSIPQHAMEGAKYQSWDYVRCAPRIARVELRRHTGELGLGGILAVLKRGGRSRRAG